MRYFFGEYNIHASHSQRVFRNTDDKYQMQKKEKKNTARHLTCIFTVSITSGQNRARFHFSELCWAVRSARQAKNTKSKIYVYLAVFKLTAYRLAVRRLDHRIFQQPVFQINTYAEHILYVGLLFWGFTTLCRYFSHIAPWKQKITNLWNCSGKTGNRTPDQWLRKPRA